MAQLVEGNAQIPPGLDTRIGDGVLIAYEIMRIMVTSRLSGQLSALQMFRCSFGDIVT